MSHQQNPVQNQNNIVNKPTENLATVMNQNCVMKKLKKEMPATIFFRMFCLPVWYLCGAADRSLAP